MALVTREERPALVGREGVRIELPDPLFHVLVNLIRQLKQGRAVVLLPEDETFTNQAAAAFLGMSRQHLVNLIEKGEIPHHRVGSHRRVTLKDLLTYQQVRDTARRACRLFRSTCSIRLDREVGWFLKVRSLTLAATLRGCAAGPGTKDQKARTSGHAIQGGRWRRFASRYSSRFKR